MEWWVCGVLGALIGPALASMAVSLPQRQPRHDRWWRGGGASPRRVVLITASAAAVWALLGWRIGWTWALPAYLGVGAAGVVLAVTDWEHYRLPDSIIWPLYGWCAAWLTAAAIAGDWPALRRAALWGVLLGVGGLTLAFIYPGKFGLGDVKLLGILGGLLGWQSGLAAFYGLMAGFLIGAFWSVGIVVVRGRRLGSQFAFGPSLLVGALLTLIII